MHRVFFFGGGWIHRTLMATLAAQFHAGNPAFSPRWKPTRLFSTGRPARAFGSHLASEIHPQRAHFPRGFVPDQQRLPRARKSRRLMRASELCFLRRMASPPLLSSSHRPSASTDPSLLVSASRIFFRTTISQSARVSIASPHVTPLFLCRSWGSCPPHPPLQSRIWAGQELRPGGGQVQLSKKEKLLS